ncbi:Retrovirus-related Pol polyprotein from transposon TNT 1-94 [Populus alba x Populus x berolinensis]|uniref:Retrovirus-related Pol polyprotein from transposon TNT 1-94 n=1 Tax=Populus alba x Populus x berolinensis TaxID=444605 RepID=A0AAD6WGP2_9ROSI|nr:Retrovirus-related Pol polyprotein from transposon TNT 1-94 [Populus alba x Populus x berolinensis]
MLANHGGDLQNDDNGGFLNEPLVGDPESANDDIDVIPEQVMQEAPDEPQLRRSTRPRQPSTKYSPYEYVLVTNGGESECFDEAMSYEKKSEWLKAMQEEMKSLHENHTFELVKLPKGKRALKNKWVFRLKIDEHCSHPRYKARLVVKGFGQKKGIDFEEIFSPVVKMSSIRVVLGLAANLNLKVEQLDVKAAFLHGDLDEEIYMEQPEGFEAKGKDQLVSKLKKSLYGLKQAPTQWYKKFDSFMVDHGYDRTTSDHCVFMKRFLDGNFIILLLYVNDMLIVGHDAKKIQILKEELSKSFAMKDLGPVKQILGMNITRDRKKEKLWLSKERYVQKVLERFNMSNSKPVCSPLVSHFKLSSKQCPSSDEEIDEMKKVPYASVVGSLMYAMVCSRPDIAHAVGVVSRFLSNPSKEHWSVVKWILRYLKGTSSFSLCFANNKPVLDGYTDADMAGDVDSRKSTSGYLMKFAEGAVSWQSRLKKCVALSTTKAEYKNKSLSGDDNDPMTPVFTPSLSSVLTVAASFSVFIKRGTPATFSFLSHLQQQQATSGGRASSPAAVQLIIIIFTSSREREKRNLGKGQYETWDDLEVPKFHYGSHYSSAGIVLFYLLRLPPFSVENQKLQGGQFDHADRLFNSIRDTWLSAAGKGNTSDVKELIPEFFYIPN